MKLFLLIAFVIAVGFIIADILIEAASLEPIERRPEGIPAGASPNQTNAIYSTSGTNGQVVQVITNAEYYIEGDIQACSVLGQWWVFDHFAFWLKEQEGASVALNWQDGPVNGTLSFTVTSETNAPASSLGLRRSGAYDPEAAECRFYRVCPLTIWRHEFYLAFVIQNSPYQQ